MLRTLLIWAIAIAFSAISITLTIGAISKNRNPQLALTVFPINGFGAQTAAAQIAATAVVENQGDFSIAIPQLSIDLAIQAFVAEPLTPQAVAVLALGSTKDIRATMMHKALEISRREAIILGWMIDDSAKRDDLYSLLDYYDISLRTSKSSNTILIPIMTGVLADERFIEPLSKKLQNNPPWAFGLWNRLPGSPEAVYNAATLRQLVFKEDEDRSKYRDKPLIASLVQNGHFDKALELYALLTGIQKDSDQVFNEKYPFSSEYPPIDWQLYSTGEFSAIISNGHFELSGISSSGGLLARRLTALPKKRIKFQIRFAQPVPADTQLAVNISCARAGSGQAVLAKIPLTGSSTQRLLDNQNASCAYHWIDIVGQSEAGGDGFFLNFKSISMVAE